MVFKILIRGDFYSSWFAFAFPELFRVNFLKHKL
ncbi:hypothetical protein ABID22_004031 [Pontibacter aydingkolensis]